MVVYWLRRLSASNKYTKRVKWKRQTQNRREAEVRQHRAGDEVSSRAWSSEHIWSSIHQGLCSKREDRVESTFPVSLTGFGSYGGSLSVKANAMGLDVRNLMRSPKHGKCHSVFSKPWAFCKYMSSGLEVWFATRACNRLLGMKSSPILANRGMV